MKRTINILVTLGLAQGLAYAQPVVSSVLNAASYDAVVSPGCWVAIFGNNLAAATAEANTAARLPTTLGGVSVTVGSLPAAMLYVSPTQINVLIPSEVAIPDNFVVPVVINAPGGSVSYNIRLTRSAPGIFTRNGAGTGRALVFDSNFQPVDTVAPKQVVIFYATGLGPTAGDSGRVVDEVDVYIGERKAQVLFAGLAPGFPGIYQLNVIAPVPATDRLYLRLVHLRLQDWQSNIVDIGIKPGTNVSNVKGSIDALYPSSDPNFGLGLQASVMLHAGTLTASFDIGPSAGPFEVAAVGDAGGAVISIDPTLSCTNSSGLVSRGQYNASINTVTSEAVHGNFSIVPLWDYVTCTGAQCFPFAGSLMPLARLGQFWAKATEMLPAPSARTSPGPNASMQVSGCLGDLQGAVGGSPFVIDGENNSSLSRFGGIVQIPWGPFATRVSRFRLYIDGAQIASTDVTYGVPYRH
ncbi:MAG: hypothetical protein JJE04_13460 [Acidobacteriia bacterium]|nr:hypothetical protein [Terriglobia bacterium]